MSVNEKKPDPIPLGSRKPSVQPGRLSVDLRDTISVVVGGTSGIGQATAVRLAEAGSVVIVTSRDIGRLALT